MRIINTLFKHPVYDGLHSLFEEVARKTNAEYIRADDIDENYHRALTFASKKYLHRFRIMHKGKEIRPSKEDIIIARSIFLSAQGFSYSLKGIKSFICEESWGEKSHKRLAFSTLGMLLKGQPFIAHIPRVQKFLESKGFETFYVPCFLPKRFSYQKGKHILYVARLVDIKHPEVIVSLAKQIPSQQFVIVATKPPGDSSLYEQIMRDAKSLPNVTVYEKLPYEKLLELYATARMLLLPSEADPIGYCVLEALSCGTPVVTTSLAGTSDYLPKGWVIDSFDTLKWQNAIESICEDESKARTLARKAFVDGKLELDGPYFRELVNRLVKRFVR